MPCSGKYIRRWRSNLGLSYRDIAKALDVDPVTVRNWERSTKLKRIVKIAFDATYRRRRATYEWTRKRRSHE